MILTLISPDKLTLAMFSKYFKEQYSFNSIIVEKELSYLFSDVYQASFIKNLKDSKNEQEIILLSYKTKISIKKLIPQDIFDYSDYIIKFDMYSTTPELLKVLDSSWFETVLNGWNLYLDKLSK